MKILHLTLKKKWFDMILSGEKKEEYRELKTYWTKRLVDSIEVYYTEFLPKGYGCKITWKEYDAISFKNGYTKDAPTFLIELLEICIDKGKKKWGAETGKEYFVLRTGKILSTTNITA